VDGAATAAPGQAARAAEAAAAAAPGQARAAETAAQGQDGAVEAGSTADEATARWRLRRKLGVSLASRLRR
jgi:hypothetical protein